MKTLLTEEQLGEGIRRMAGEIKKHYQGRPLTIVGVMIDAQSLEIGRFPNPSGTK